MERIGEVWGDLGNVWGSLGKFEEGLGKVLVMFGDFWEDLGRSVIIIIGLFGSVSSDEARTYQRHHPLIV